MVLKIIEEIDQRGPMNDNDFAALTKGKPIKRMEKHVSTLEPFMKKVTK